MDDCDVGILYVSTGSEFIEETLLSAKVVKQHMDVPIAVASDRVIDNEVVDINIKIEHPEYGFGDQISALARTPFEKTLYLDSDIFLYTDVFELFSMLDRFELVACHAPVRSQDLNGESSDMLPSACFPEYNSGVVGYRLTDPMRSFLTDWKTEYRTDSDRGVSRNQPSFRRALYHSNLQIGTLPPEYNCRFQFPGQATGIVKIFHGRLTPIKTNSGGAPHLMDIESVAKKINKSTDPRVFYPRGNTVTVRTLSGSILYRLRYSLKLHGVGETLRRIIGQN